MSSSLPGAQQEFVAATEATLAVCAELRLDLLPRPREELSPSPL